MNNEEKYKITSNDFADLIADDLILQRIITMYSDVSVQRINNQYSIVYLPVENMNSNIIYNFGYETIPKCYGLMTVPSSEAMVTQQFENIPINYLSGQGVLIGVVDTGIDYMNLAFQDANQSTRIISIWDQTIESENQYPVGYFYGTEYSKEQINRAINTENPLAIVPSIDEIGHGTALAGIAGGSYNEENGFRGIATNNEFVVVKLKPAKPYLKEFFFLPQDTICYQENDIMLAINYLIQVAKQNNRPIVICLGLGSSQGAHLGDGIFNSFLSTMGRLGDVSIVVAGGNEGNRQHHYFGEIIPDIGAVDVELNIGEDETGFFMEFWGNAPNVYSIDIFAPSGELVAQLPTFFIQTDTIIIEIEDTTIFVDNTIEDSLVGDQFILFRFGNPISGIWRFRIFGVGDLVSSFHIWLPIHNFITEGTFFLNANPYTIITAPGNEETVVTATAYNNINQELYYYASKGFTKDNHPKPDITAPGVNIMAPAIGNQYTSITGTGAAAAYTAGGVALLLEWGIVRGNYLSLPSAKIRSILTSGAFRTPNMIYPNPDWGFGILDIDNSIRIVSII